MLVVAPAVEPRALCVRGQGSPGWSQEVQAGQARGEGVVPEVGPHRGPWWGGAGQGALCSELCSSGL